MAKTNKIRLSEFVPQQTDVITFDSNILIKLLYPTMTEKAPTAAYEDLYSKILRAKSSLIISSVQISEFVNRCIRFQFALFKDSQNNSLLDFKKRLSQHGGLCKFYEGNFRYYSNRYHAFLYLC